MKQSNLAKVFKALSNEQRLKIFEMIYHENQKAFKESSCGCAKLDCCGVKKAFSMMCQKLCISKSTISHHIKELQNAGLIECIKDGQSCICKINDDVLAEIKNFLD